MNYSQTDKKIGALLSVEDYWLLSMRNFIALTLLLLPSLLQHFGISSFQGSAAFAQNVAINATGAVASTSALLDLDDANKGLLIPRVSLTSTADIVTIASPATSLLVYNTASAGTIPNNVGPGFYYWDGARWVPFGHAGAIFSFADFYALMPGDNAATVAAGAAVAFPNAGPTSGSGISATSGTQFQLAVIGTYMISWQVSIAEAAQLVLELNGAEILSTVVGRATGTNQLVGNRLLTTTVSNSILRVVNPLGSPTALTITPIAGGARPVSASLVITRLQ